MDEDYALRFGGIGRLFSLEAMECLRLAHIVVVGIGGVGSWTAEALARSGVGKITLVDLDDVCVTNINRQIHALDGKVGKPKISVMSERIQRIHPECEVNQVHAFLTGSNVEEVLQGSIHGIVDAIDGVNNKCLLIQFARRNKIPIVVAGGAGGKRNPCAVQPVDLYHTVNDKLLKAVRRTLRRDFGFPKNPKRKFKVTCVYSPEEVVYPTSDGSACSMREEGGSLGLNCESGFGTASFVTGSFGFVLAAEIIQLVMKSAEARKESIGKA